MLSAQKQTLLNRNSSYLREHPLDVCTYANLSQWNTQIERAACSLLSLAVVLPVSETLFNL